MVPRLIFLGPQHFSRYFLCWRRFLLTGKGGGGNDIPGGVSPNNPKGKVLKRSLVVSHSRPSVVHRLLSALPLSSVIVVVVVRRKPRIDGDERSKMEEATTGRTPKQPFKRQFQMFWSNIPEFESNKQSQSQAPITTPQTCQEGHSIEKTRKTWEIDKRWQTSENRMF